MKIIHLSDLHYGQPGSTTQNARVINALLERPDISECIVIITGDVVDTPEDTIYRTATSALRQLSEACAELVMVPGNHDLSTKGVTPHLTAHIKWGAHVENLTKQRPAYPSMRVDGGVAIISIDTNREPPGIHRLTQNITATGYVGPDQIEAVAGMVQWARRLSIPTVIALHHCPSGGDPLLRLHDRRELGDALEAAGGVDLILSGHLHQKCEWSNVIGARLLISSPKSPDAQGYRVLWWDEDRRRFVWEWVEVK